MEMVCDPGMAVTVPPVQVVLALGVGATIIPSVVEPGKSSVMEALINGEVFVLRRVMVNVDMPPGLTVGGVKTLLIEKSVTVSTVRSSVSGFGTVRFWVLVISVGRIVLV